MTVTIQNKPPSKALEAQSQELKLPRSIAEETTLEKGRGKEQVLPEVTGYGSLKLPPWRSFTGG